MKEVTLIIPEGNRIPQPYSDQDLEILDGFKRGVPLRCKISGTRKGRSLAQLRMYRAWCAMCAENTDDPHWNTGDKVHDQVRYALGWVDMSRVTVFPDGTIHFPLRSMSFAETEHLEACKYVDRACPIIAEKMGISEQELRDESRPGYWPKEHR